MSRQKKYHQDILMLVKSITFRLHEVGFQINEGLMRKFSLTGISLNETHPETWKYYLNLSGEYHHLDTQVIIKTYEDKVERVLTKQLLIDYPSTKTELRKLGSYFDATVAMNPGSYSIVRGMCYPVPIETALNAENGTILAYNEKLVDHQEFTLIPEIEKEIKGYLKRWHIKEYMIMNNLYVADLVVNLTNVMMLKIINHRTKTSFTQEAHSFHMESYFDSHMSLWEDVKVLPLTTRMWLFKHLRFLVKNIGKSSTLETLIKNIFTGSGIIVSEFGISQEAPKDDTAFNHPKFFITPLNGKLSTKTEVSVPELLTKGFETSNKFGFYDPADQRFKKEISDKLFQTRFLEQRTKSLFIGDVLTGVIAPNNKLETVIGTWVNAVMSNRFETRVMFTDPNSKIKIAITPLDGLLFLLFLIGKASGASEDFMLNSIISNTVPRDNITIANFLHSRLLDPRIPEIVELLTELKPSEMQELKTVHMFHNEITDKLAYLDLAWRMFNEVDDIAVAVTIKQFEEYIYVKKEFMFPVPVNLYEHVRKLGLTDGFNKTYDYEKTISSLLKTFTNTEMSTIEATETVKQGYKNILHKLTSYTVQVLDNSVTARILVPRINLGPLRGLNIAKTKEVNFRCLEDFEGNLSGLPITRDELWVFFEPRKYFFNDTVRQKVFGTPYNNTDMNKLSQFNYYHFGVALEIAHITWYKPEITSLTINDALSIWSENHSLYDTGYISRTYSWSKTLNTLEVVGSYGVTVSFTNHFINLYKPEVFSTDMPDDLLDGFTETRTSASSNVPVLDAEQNDEPELQILKSSGFTVTL